MSIDIKELKRLAQKVAECEDRPEIADEHAEAADALWLHMHCHTILGMIEEIERLTEKNELLSGLRSAVNAAIALENDDLRKYLQYLVENEDNQEENQSVRHAMVEEAKCLLAGKTKERGQ
ncbi:hypothetical protein [uncultured Pseudomonas sp.]|uniref:hypothetical protein n=1 Tax=uncultured Pseudomonas sp. TaxID=114707 RepID=UPI002589592B|nr:hypothetical protein [uncultured Pseudomonas sp.]